MLGVWQNGLIVLHDGKPRAVGESQVHHNLHPKSAKLIEGEPLEVVSYKVDMRGKHLAWLLERIDKQRAYYLNGKMLVGKELKAVTDINLYRPADFDGKVLHLHYARSEELAPYLYMVAAHGEVYVQFWLRPGDLPVEVSLGEEGQKEVIHERSPTLNRCSTFSRAALRGTIGGALHRQLLQRLSERASALATALLRYTLIR